MKKRFIAMLLTALVAVSVIIPISASAAAETWNYGYDKKKMQHYSDYYHAFYRHYTTMTKNGVTYVGPTAQPKYWSKFRLDYTGPYKVTFKKYSIK
ncbi:lactococcin 972 family bacteriocin [Bacillus amyloliquefaciens]|uniref:lactococcin 972 family bacteriocin n=1 Tax=Bacillus amyloliquefaciens TaxID=1390 RepID=UPI002D7F502C|nr:lactococcin 972 family bacteriocin [Bacillus amyloliquefaciens]MEB4596201.1 lactococcin 972 family bacteriocin [Bacillus amyloliquefaciens]